MSWREIAFKTIKEVDESLPQDADYKTVCRELSTAYPFGDRSMHPYKIWLSERERYLRRRFPEQFRAKDHERLVSAIATAGLLTLDLGLEQL